MLRQYVNPQVAPHFHQNLNQPMWVFFIFQEAMNKKAKKIVVSIIGLQSNWKKVTDNKIICTPPNHYHRKKKRRNSIIDNGEYLLCQ